SWPHWPRRRRSGDAEAGQPTRLRSWGETSEASTTFYQLIVRREADRWRGRGGRRGRAMADDQVIEQPVADDRPSPHAWRPARFMVITAHPDDAEFGPAATAARWIDEGSVGWLVCCTSGDQGGEDPELDPLVLAATREAEQRRAAGTIGYAGISFLHQPDGALANELALRELLVREI